MKQIFIYNLTDIQ